MPKLAVIGHQKTPEPIEPVVIPVAAYTASEPITEVIEEFQFKGFLPPMVQRFLERAGASDLGIDGTLRCLNDLLVTQEERDRWIDFYQRDDLTLDAMDIAEMFKVLLEYYGKRPTRRSSGSSRTGGRSARTSKAAAPSAA